MSTYDGTGPLPPCPCGGYWTVERWESSPRYRCALCRGPIPAGWLELYRQYLEQRDGAEAVARDYPALRGVKGQGNE